MLAAPGEDDLALVRRRLLQQAFVFEDPAVYAAGVEDALAAVRELHLRRDDEVSGLPEVVVLDESTSLLRGAAG